MPARNHRPLRLEEDLVVVGIVSPGRIPPPVEGSAQGIHSQVPIREVVVEQTRLLLAAIMRSASSLGRYQGTV